MDSYQNSQRLLSNLSKLDSRIENVIEKLVSKIESMAQSKINSSLTDDLMGIVQSLYTALDTQSDEIPVLNKSLKNAERLLPSIEKHCKKDGLFGLMIYLNRAIMLMK